MRNPAIRNSVQNRCITSNPESGLPATISGAIERGTDRFKEKWRLFKCREVAACSSRGPPTRRGVLGAVDDGSFQERYYPGGVHGTSLKNSDFAAYAQAFGAYGELVETTEQFALALQRALFTGPPRSPRSAPRRAGGHAVDDVVGHPRRSTEETPRK